MGRHTASDGRGREAIKIPRDLSLRLPERRAVEQLLEQMREHAFATAWRHGFGQVALERHALTSRAKVGVMLSRQTRAPGRPECWHLVISEWRDGQRQAATPAEFAAWIGCGWPELDAVDTFALVSGRHAVIPCSTRNG